MANSREEHPHTQLIKNLMVKHSLYQKDVAAALGLTQANINKGMHDPTSKTFIKIAQFFVEKYGEDEAQFTIDVFKASQKRDKDTGKTLAILLKMATDTNQKLSKMAKDLSEVKRKVDVLEANQETYQRARDIDKNE